MLDGQHAQPGNEWGQSGPYAKNRNDACEQAQSADHVASPRLRCDKQGRPAILAAGVGQSNTDQISTCFQIKPSISAQPLRNPCEERQEVNRCDRTYGNSEDRCSSGRSGTEPKAVPCFGKLIEGLGQLFRDQFPSPLATVVTGTDRVGSICGINVTSESLSLITDAS